MTGSDLALLARTAVHLRPSQIAQRARLRAQHQALRRFPAAGRWLLAGPDPASAAGWPAGFVPLDARLWRNWPGLPGLREGRLELLGMTRTLARSADGGQETGGAGDPAGGDRMRAHWARTDWAQADWAQAGAPALWRFHLHYWDWAWGLTAQPLRADARAWFAALWRSWHAAVTPGQGDAWHPYPAALRAWSFCGVHRDLVAGSDTEDRFIASLSAHAGFLRRHLETDVGGNHLIKNLKALAGLAVFFADEELLDQALDRLTRQLAVQVLPDGGHFERAPAYHCQVLGDLIDVDGLIRAAGQAPGPELAEAIERMRHWLGVRTVTRRAGPAAQRRVPGRPCADRRCCSRARPGRAAAGPAGHRPGPGVGRRVAPAGRRRRRPALTSSRRMRTRIPSAAWSTWMGRHCWWTPARPHTRRARCVTTSGPPRLTTPSRWTAPTPPRCGARSGPPGGPG